MGAVLVAGTSSWAGKSVLTTALCASLRRRGLHAVPFKAQNMSNNARVADGGEIGAAQYFQALAAGVTPCVDHNPVLLKPEADTRSQVVVLGQVDRVLSDMPWRERWPHLWAVVRDAYDRVARDADVVVIEGAGSPAEINLADGDLANLRIGRHAAAPMVVVCDIDRGGAFAHLYGTWALLDPPDQRRVAGFVLNRFRGDPSLLEPGPEILEKLTGVPTLGVVPMVDHGLPDEDGADPGPPTGSGRRVRVVRGPAASNLDEWWPLREASDCRWATAPEHLADAELVVLPGSKVPMADLAWLRSTGMDRAVVAAHERGVGILAVCGGAQILGEVVEDPHGVEGGGAAPGLGVLPATTRLGPSKQVCRSVQRFRDDLPAPWAGLAGLEVAGYEVHFGETWGRPPVAPAFCDGSGLVQAAAAARSGRPVGGEGPAIGGGAVLAVYLHGLAEDPRVLAALAGRPPRRSFPDIFEGLADLADRYLDVEAVLSLAR